MMLPDIENLLLLQEADKEIRRLNEEIAAFPKRVAAIEEKLAGTNAILDKAKAAVKADEADRGRSSSTRGVEREAGQAARRGIRRCIAAVRARHEVPRQRPGRSSCPEMHGLPGDAASANIQRSEERSHGDVLRLVPARAV